MVAKVSLALCRLFATTCGEILNGQHASCSHYNVCFSRLGSFWVLYCTAYGTKENVRISTTGLDSLFFFFFFFFYTVVYI